jgi:peroxiredoxin
MAADLKGRTLPDVDLVSTLGGTVNLSRARGYSVVFICPWTGRQGHDNPAGWDDIPGAHGSTPQILSYNKMLQQFAEIPCQVYGVSSLRPAWQKQFAENNGLSFALLSDEQEAFSRALNLDWFQAGARRFLNRRTLIARNGVVQMDRQSIGHPEDDAGQSLALLRVLMKP